MKFLKFFTHFFYYTRCYLWGNWLFNTRVAFVGKNISVTGKKSFLAFAKSVTIQDNVFFQLNGKFTLGERSMIKRDAYVIVNKGELRVGANSAIGKRNEISVNGGEIHIGSFVRIASNVFITNANHEFTDVDTPIMEQGIVTKNIIIEDNVWIGHGAIILPGVTIGKGAIIAAGSIVNKDVAELTIVGGNPARFLRSRNN